MNNIDETGERKLKNGIIARNEYYIGDQPTGAVVLCDPNDPGMHLIRLERWARNRDCWMITHNRFPLDAIFERPDAESEMPPLAGTLETMLERFGNLRLKKKD